jgi:hypothetical protein
MKYLAKVIAVMVAGLIVGLLFVSLIQMRIEKLEDDSPRGIWYKERSFTMDDGTPCTVIWWDNSMEAAGVTCDYGKVKGDDDE